jgi:hypothetical protein
MKELIKTFLAGLAAIIPILVLIALFNIYPQVIGYIALVFFGLVAVLFVGCIIRGIFDDY